MQIQQFLRSELASRPGRLEYVLRITLLTLLVVIVAETFQIPLPAYSAYIVFFISREETASTLFTGILITISITIAVFLALGIYTVSAGEPGLRLPLMALVIFAGMFISRASPLGTAGFVIGFLVTLSLTLIDFIPRSDPRPSADILTRAVLWLWVVVMLPVSIVTFANILTGRNPLDLFNQGLIKRLKLVGQMLIHHDDNPNDRKQLSVYAEEGMGNLLKYLKMAGMFNKKFPKGANERLVANTQRLIILLNEWIDLKISDPMLLKIASECGATLLNLTQSMEKNQDLVYQKPILPSYEGHTVSERKGFLLLATILKLIEELLPSEASIEPSEKSTLQFLVADAFTNPDYVHYALKTTLAIFIAYISYNMLYWPGIRTCMITCFFVSLGSLGETAQKMILRLSGALIGGTLGLATIIYIMPYLTTITHLCMVLGVVTFFAAWVATSSERLSYAGMQIALAFFLSILVGYGPTIDMTEARDRVIGVILGNLIIFIIFSNIWPTSAVVQARLSLSAALEKLSQIFAQPALTLDKEKVHRDKLFFALSDAISQAKRLASLEPFESYAQQIGITVNIALVEAVQALYGPVIILENLPTLVSSSPYYKSLTTWFSHVSEEVLHGRLPIQPLPKIEKLHEPSANIWQLSSLDWYHTLDERLHVVDMQMQKSFIPNDILLNQATREST